MEDVLAQAGGAPQAALLENVPADALAANVAQVQAMLGISRHLAYALIGDGDIPGMKIGNAYRVPKIMYAVVILREKKSPVIWAKSLI